MIWKETEEGKILFFESENSSEPVKEISSRTAEEINGYILNEDGTVSLIEG